MTDTKTEAVLETMEFQTEVRKMLDIVIHSLYTDKEIFLRELISNAADALEKARYLEAAGQAEPSGEALEIHIETDEENHAVTVRDTGVGMTRDEVIENLGTIAHSGARSFLENLGNRDGSDVNLIGQFGVGFYSAFMVAREVRLTSRSVRAAEPVVWESSGDGTYRLGVAGPQPRGTSIRLTLKEKDREYADPFRIREIIRQYSSFVPFPVFLNGERVNTMEALWKENKNDIGEDRYQEFYKYLAEDYQNPLLYHHFSVDAPLSIQSILFCPGENLEQRGLGKLEGGVRIYSRRVMIREKSDELLPPWLRFLRGVVDSDEIPLNISRETMQDSALMRKLGRIITGRFLSYLDDLSRKDPDLYLEFYRKFGIFLKEGLASDAEHQEKLLKLLRFETSGKEAGQFVSLDEYLESAGEDAGEIYYLSGSGREALEKSPYLEVFRQKEREVLFSYDGLDDYVLSMAGNYRGKRFVSAENAELAVDKATAVLNDPELEELTQWMKDSLGEQVSEVKISDRLVESPALVKNPLGMTSNLERWFTLMEDREAVVAPRILEINPSHPLMEKLYRHKQVNPERALLAAQQIFDQAMLSAGLPVDIRKLVERMNRLLEETLDIQETAQ